MVTIKIAEKINLLISSEELRFMNIDEADNINNPNSIFIMDIFMNDWLNLLDNNFLFANTFTGTNKSTTA